MPRFLHVLRDRVRETLAHVASGPATRRAADGAHRPIHMGAGTWIGAGAIIFPGVTIGPGSIVGAGAVVTKDAPANTVIAGVPARPIRELDKGGSTSA
ncbi:MULTISPECIES: DapH/DapD/GlmU-related protein [Helcobacillus]|uniref:DapH/DapD/GlmU-related protein n=1 Tax=Helcobacillus TaxID=1161125 RepID=UPI002882E97F|nr:DapH/DapD/GlmU-related protein [Helcobacillus massiliensis]